MSFRGLVTVTVPLIQLFMWSSRRITVTNFIESSAGDQAERSVTGRLLYTAAVQLARHAYQELAHWQSVFLFRSWEKKLTIEEGVQRRRESSPNYLKNQAFAKSSPELGKKRHQNYSNISQSLCSFLLHLSFSKLCAWCNFQEEFLIKKNSDLFLTAFVFLLGFVPFLLLFRFLWLNQRNLIYSKSTFCANFLLVLILPLFWYFHPVIYCVESGTVSFNYNPF